MQAQTDEDGRKFKDTWKKEGSWMPSPINKARGQGKKGKERERKPLRRHVGREKGGGRVGGFRQHGRVLAIFYRRKGRGETVHRARAVWMQLKDKEFLSSHPIRIKAEERKRGERGKRKKKTNLVYVLSTFEGEKSSRGRTGKKGQAYCLIRDYFTEEEKKKRSPSALRREAKGSTRGQSG